MKILVVGLVLLTASICGFYVSEAYLSRMVSKAYANNVFDQIDEEARALLDSYLVLAALYDKTIIGNENKIEPFDNSDAENFDMDVPCCGGSEDGSSMANIKILTEETTLPEIKNTMDVLEFIKHELSDEDINKMGNTWKRHNHIMATMTDEEKRQYEFIRRSIYEKHLKINQRILQGSKNEIEIPEKHMNVINNLLRSMSDTRASSEIYFQRLDMEMMDAYNLRHGSEMTFPEH